MDAMNERSLSRLYRRLHAARPHAALDAHDLVDAVAHAAGSATRVGEHHDAVVAELASSPVHADLARVLRALEPESERLAQQVEAARGSVVALAPRQQHKPAGTHSRPLGWIGAIAAGVMVAFGAWSWHAEQRAPHSGDVAATTMPDRIFTSQDHIFASSDAPQGHGAHHHDELFHADFSKGG